MRFHSTPESVQNGEITKLAIIECFAAIAVYIGIAIHFRTFRYFAVAIALAPLTLLRTEASVKWGIQKWDRTERLMDRTDHSVWIVIFVIMPIHALSGLVIRVIATFYWSARTPLETLQTMPRNWLRQAFCTDFFYPPEVIPDEKVYYPEHTTAADVAAEILETVRSEKVPVKFLIPLMVTFGPVFGLSFLPALFYRVSFKATSLAYYPFVWVAGITFGTVDSLKTRLERFTKGELEKTRRWVSGFVATALAIKVGLALGWLDFSEALAEDSVQKARRDLSSPKVWHWWQITLGLDALLTFSLLYYADAALGRLDTKDAWDSEAVTKTLSSVSFLRASLAILTMSHFFWLAFKTMTSRYVTF